MQSKGYSTRTWQKYILISTKLQNLAKRHQLQQQKQQTRRQDEERQNEKHLCSKAEEENSNKNKENNKMKVSPFAGESRWASLTVFLGCFASSFPLPFGGTSSSCPHDDETDIFTLNH